MSLMSRSAAELARQGWPVFPCHAGSPCSCGRPDCASPAKHPRSRRGLHDATVDLAAVGRWWRRWPEANLAVRTGARPAGAGVVVLDVDPAHGGDLALEALVADRGPLPATLEVATGGGGRHLYFAHPGGVVPNSAGRLGLGLDVRGDGGYVVVPPSRHPAGPRYRWSPAPLAPLPAWLHQLMLPPPPPPRPDPPAVSRPGTWAAAALADEAAGVRAAPEGVRNHTLNRAAFALGQLVAGGHLDETAVVAELLDAAATAGLGEGEARATVASGLRAGASFPRHPALR
jgi:hypothetical protein